MAKTREASLNVHYGRVSTLPLWHTALVLWICEYDPLLYCLYPPSLSSFLLQWIDSLLCEVFPYSLCALPSPHSMIVLYPPPFKAFVEMAITLVIANLRSCKSPTKHKLSFTFSAGPSLYWCSPLPFFCVQCTMFAEISCNKAEFKPKWVSEGLCQRTCASWLFQRIYTLDYFLFLWLSHITLSFSGSFLTSQSQIKLGAYIKQQGPYLVSMINENYFHLHVDWE